MSLTARRLIPQTSMVWGILYELYCCDLAMAYVDALWPRDR